MCLHAIYLCCIGPSMAQTLAKSCSPTCRDRRHDVHGPPVHIAPARPKYFISCCVFFCCDTKDRAMTCSSLARYIYLFCIRTRYSQHHALMLCDYNLYLTELINSSGQATNLFESICLLLDFCTEANVCRYIMSNVLQASAGLVFSIYMRHCIACAPVHPCNNWGRKCCRD